MTFFQISVRKMSGENSHCKEENTVKMMQTSFSVDCNDDSDCLGSEECVADSCVPVACDPACGEGGYCKSMGNHEAECECDTGYYLDTTQTPSCGNNLLMAAHGFNISCRLFYLCPLFP